MEVKCTCGRLFEVPEGTRSAKCPGCGKAVEVGKSEDWLQDFDMEELSLEEQPEAEASPAPTPPAATAPAGDGEQAAAEQPGAEQAPGGGQARSNAQAAAAASRGTRAVAPTPPRANAPPIKRLRSKPSRLIKENSFPLKRLPRCDFHETPSCRQRRHSTAPAR